MQQTVKFLCLQNIPADLVIYFAKQVFYIRQSLGTDEMSGMR